MRIFLQFVPSQGNVHRLRLTYAFRLFCAIWNHDPVLDPGEAASCDAKITYSPLKNGAPQKTLRLENLYHPRAPQAPAPPPTEITCDGEYVPVFYAPPQGGRPDLLAELFEWVSCADEYSVKQRDSVGRIPFCSSYVGRHSLDVRRPYAAVVMRLLQASLHELTSNISAKASPTPGKHFIINTHDVDYLPLSRLSSIKRLLKNAAVSLLVAGSPHLALNQTLDALRRAFAPHDALDQMPGLIEGETNRSVGASYYIIPVRKHRRDANYDVADPKVLATMREVAKSAEVGVHASYTSLDHEKQLEREFDGLRQLGFRPSGGRQHWLRFTLDRLIPEVEQAGAEYDCSLGWNDRVGFRAGASFAFPPYDFENERPAQFLEIPLVMMDQALLERSAAAETLLQSATALLSASRANGWGGISVLWHPAAFGGGQLAEEVGHAFWKLLDLRKETNDVWLSGEQFMALVQDRYRRVGLLRPSTAAMNKPLIGVIEAS